MSEPLKKTPKKKPVTELSDNEAIRKLFPKKIVDKVNQEIGYEPNQRPSGTTNDSEKNVEHER